MSDENKTVIEINGIKMEIDLRYAKTIDTYRIGDRVKILIKGYGDTFKSYSGAIVGFDAFAKLPTIIVCYMKAEYGNSSIEFAYINAESKDVELCHVSDAENLDICAIEDAMQSAVDRKQLEVDELKAKQSYFRKHYNKAIGEATKELT